MEPTKKMVDDAYAKYEARATGGNGYSNKSMPGDAFESLQKGDEFYVLPEIVEIPIGKKPTTGVDNRNRYEAQFAVVTRGGTTKMIPVTPNTFGRSATSCDVDEKRVLLRVNDDKDPVKNTGSAIDDFVKNEDVDKAMSIFYDPKKLAVVKEESRPWVWNTFQNRPQRRKFWEINWK